MSTGLEALPYRHVLTVPAMGSAVRIARETTEQVLAEWGVGRRHPCVDPALLMVAELVTNSVRHAAELSPSLTVVFAGGPDTFAFAVHDRHPHQPALHDAFTGTGSGTGSGGLATVVELTLQLGGSAVVRADADGRGKSIWITLPL
ncbi:MULTISPECIES: ATP-binding protein [unclassified Streptomyces]|uniref:ATP-binding protein n=1 Tax=unclassified Streptomyces TaxID=2593676 RepID=UPI000F5C14DD|nr:MULTISPECIES: ATP-binding protein [unclassified Streptomyces]WSG54093.1 ATP-binding protein [Streptomyces sp. NBC_01732]WSX04723.1 ATP-binding protein [Streptomyces sp. NBC_00987]MCX5105113.1 ATP-binding protein [Streptomyces sp. NBC_00439]RPK63801.1 Histidine kinase-, DNA gyrase B-, and HSP90-like ATPase [Streptomyces sp. ADI95-17]WSP45869.1 ATP-binding protein [Streptomyces sp. NBC_01243]